MSSNSLQQELTYGGTNLDFQMEQYTYILNLKGTWEKFPQLACAIVTTENQVEGYLGGSVG